MKVDEAKPLQGLEFLARACLDFWLPASFSWQDGRLSRPACPVISEPRYEPDRAADHYRRALATIRRYSRP